MIRRAADLAAAKIPFVFDPGQGLPMFDGADLRAFIAQATLVTVNFQAPEFYARHGWEEFGRIASAPGVERIFIRKTLAA